jgi:hypothetical protein
MPERMLEPRDLEASSSLREKRLLILFRMVVRRFGFRRSCVCLLRGICEE